MKPHAYIMCTAFHSRAHEICKEFHGRAVAEKMKLVGIFVISHMGTLVIIFFMGLLSYFHGANRISHSRDGRLGITWCMLPIL